VRAFAELYTALDETNKTGAKVDALVGYFAGADPADAAWALYFLIGRRPRQAVSSTKLRAWAAEAAGIPDWLFGESYDAVGDFAETVALLLPDHGPRAEERGPAADAWGAPRAQQPDDQASSMFSAQPLALRAWVEQVLLPLRDLPEERQRAEMLRAWEALSGAERFVWNKLITGAFRVGVSQQLVTRALAQVGGLDAATVAHRLMGAWEPSAAFYRALLAPESGDADVSRPFPFCLAHPLEGEPDDLGEIAEWQAEWKWDGIRSQLVRRAGQTFLWSRGEELITERFPELAALGALLPDGTVLDGEVLPWLGGVLPFAQLQRRIGRKQLGKKLLAEVPAVLLAYDLLELGGRDVRQESLAWRRAELERLVAGLRPEGADPSDGRGERSALESLILSPLVEAVGWDELAALWATAREQGVEGLMLKRRSSAYGVGRVRGDWWKWKVAPYTVDAVLVYAQRGSGKRASLYTDYTFALWDNGQLVPFAKAYSGLTDAEIRRVDAFVRRSTLEKFGPVRTVRPELVFELAFEGIQRSSRHKSGIAVRFPRMLRWRTDKRPEDADTLDTVRAMIPEE
jgi:DNA ligase-1